MADTSVTAPLGLSAAPALIGQDVAATKQARADIQSRDSEMESVIKDMSAQKFDKPAPTLDAKPFQPPPQQDPVKAWGSATSILAMIGSLATRHPLTASIKSATSAMNAARQANADAYQTAFDQWKSDSEFAFKRATWENDQYKEAFDMYSKNQEQSLARVKQLALLNKDTAMLATLNSGNISSMVELSNARQNAIRTGLEAQKDTLEMGQIQERKLLMDRFKRENPNASLDDTLAFRQKLDAKAAASGGASGGGRYAGQVQRVMTDASDATSELENLVKLPVTADTGWFGARGADAHKSMMDSSLGVLQNKVTPQDVQDYNTMAVGLGRALAGLETGGMQVNQGLMNQFEKLQLMDGDTNLTKMRKLATMRQNGANALESMLTSPMLGPDQVKYAQGLLTRLKKAVPWTPNDVTSLEHSQNPEATLGDIAKSSGLGGESKFSEGQLLHQNGNLYKVINGTPVYQGIDR